MKTLSQSVHNPQKSISKLKNISPRESKIQQQHTIPLNDLMIQLGNYRELKQLPLNPVSEQKEQLWRDSPCTVRYANRHVSLDKIERFSFGSIYYKDDINQQKKVFTESEKPELMLKNFRRQIEEATFSKRKYSQNSSNLSPQKTKHSSFHARTLTFFDSKLYQVPEKIQLKYDRNGTRSTYLGQYNVKNIMQKLRSTSKNFSSSQRNDLALPLNFNPGPGKYFPEIDDFLSNRLKRLKKDSERGRNLQKVVKS